MHLYPSVTLWMISAHRPEFKQAKKRNRWQSSLYCSKWSAKEDVTLSSLLLGLGLGGLLADHDKGYSSL
jgi:hypothetical protein